MNKPIQLAFAALALCAAQQCSAALPLSFPVARDWLYERSDKLKASEEQVQSKRETQKSLETLGGPTVTLQAMQIAGQKKIDIDKSIPNPLAGAPCRSNRNLADLYRRKNFCHAGCEQIRR